MGNYGKQRETFPDNSFQECAPFVSLLQLSDVFRGYITDKRLA